MNLTPDQQGYLQRLLENKSYPDAYRYLGDLVKQSGGSPALAQWFKYAGDINGDTGSFWSEFVHNSTIRNANNADVPFTRADFQAMSDVLAEVVIGKIADSGKVPPTAGDIIAADFENATGLAGGPYAFAGILGTWIFFDHNLLPQVWDEFGEKDFQPAMVDFIDKALTDLGAMIDSPDISDWFFDLNKAAWRLMLRMAVDGYRRWDPDISDEQATNWMNATIWMTTHDPFVLDLDSDGLRHQRIAILQNPVRL